MVDLLEMWLMKTAFKIAYVILVPVSRYKLDWNILGGTVFRYPLLGRNEADPFNLRGKQLGPFIPGKKRRVLSKTPTSPYKRHNSSEIRRDLAKKQKAILR